MECRPPGQRKAGQRRQRSSTFDRLEEFVRQEEAFGPNWSRTRLRAGTCPFITQRHNRPWAKQGCEVAIASIADADGLTKAFSGVAGVFLMTAQSRFEPSGRAPTSANKRGPRGPARLVKHREDFPESNISKGFAACQVLCAIELVEGLARDLLRGKA